VRFGWAPEKTTGAWSVSPLVSVTPVTRPPATSMLATGAPVRIVAPAARDALAGPQLLGHARAADDVARLEHARPQAGALQVRGGGEAVVPRLHDDRDEVRSGAVAAHAAASM
jgi:hypothetical protein